MSKLRRVLGVVLAAVLAVTGLLVAPTAHAASPSVTISGPGVIGGMFWVHPEGFDVLDTCQFFVDGVAAAIPRMCDYGFAPRAEHLGKVVTATATGTVKGQPVTATSAGIGPLGVGPLLMAAPLKGEALVGQILEASARAIEPDATFTFQWFTGIPGAMKPVPGATSSTFAVTTALLGRWISVEVTGTRPPFLPKVLSVMTKNEVRPNVIRPGTVRIHGDSKVGGHLDLESVGWEFWVSQAIQWRVDGKAVAGETDWGLTVRPEWVGRSITVSVTATSAGVPDVTVTAAPVRVLPGQIYSYPNFQNNQPVVGFPVRVIVVRDTPADPVVTYSWFRVNPANPSREIVIPGVTGPFYRLTEADIGFQVGVRTTVSAKSYTTVTTRWVTRIPVVFSVYMTPGEHLVNGRQWRTTCAAYSSAVDRCVTEIWTRRSEFIRGRWVVVTGWAFNNLTYLPSLPSDWGRNPLARTGQWRDASGRAWKTECRSAHCQTYVWSRPGAGDWLWVFNSQVYFG